MMLQAFSTEKQFYTILDQLILCAFSTYQLQKTCVVPIPVVIIITIGNIITQFVVVSMYYCLKVLKN